MAQLYCLFCQKDEDGFVSPVAVEIGAGGADHTSGSRHGQTFNASLWRLPRPHASQFSVAARREE